MNIEATEILMDFVKNKELIKYKDKDIKIDEYENLKIIKDICYLWNKEYSSKFKASSFAIFIKEDIKGSYISAIPDEREDFTLSEEEVIKFKNSSIKFIDSYGRSSVLVIFLKTLYDLPKNTCPINILDVNGVELKSVGGIDLNDYEEAFYSLQSLKSLKSDFYIFTS